MVIVVEIQKHALLLSLFYPGQGYSGSRADAKNTEHEVETHPKWDIQTLLWAIYLCHSTYLHVFGWLGIRAISICFQAFI